MRNRAVPVVLFLLASFFPGCGGGGEEKPAPAEKAKAPVEKKLDLPNLLERDLFTVRYPKAWETQDLEYPGAPEGHTAVAILSPLGEDDPFRENLLIGSNIAEKDKPLEFHVANYIASAENKAGKFDFVEEKTFESGGNRIYRAVFIVPTRSAANLLYIVHAGKAVLHFHAMAEAGSFSEYAPVFEAIYGSLVLK